MKKWLKIVLMVVILALLFVIGLTIITSKEIQKVRTMPIGGIDLSKIKDGTYPGKYRYGGFDYEVNVTVKGHRMIGIEITGNRETEYAKRAEDVVPRVMRAQSLKVDAVTGATTTSKALLKAIENALSGK